jgi:hypothetical protein
VGISRHDWLEERDKDRLETMTYALGVGNDAGVRGTGAVDGIAALLCLARDTGAARGQIAASCDIICQRMVARCLEAVSSTVYTLNPSMHVCSTSSIIVRILSQLTRVLTRWHHSCSVM